MTIDPTLIARLPDLIEKATSEPWLIVADKHEFNDAFWIGIQHPELGWMSFAEVRNGADDDEYGGEAAEKGRADLIALTPTIARALLSAQQEIERLEEVTDENRAARYRQALYIIANSGDYTLLHPDENETAEVQAVYSEGATAGKRSLAEFAQQKLAEIDDNPDAPIPHGGDFLRANTAESRADAIAKRLEEIAGVLSDLNITDEELTRLRNKMEGKDWVQVWSHAAENHRLRA